MKVRLVSLFGFLAILIGFFYFLLRSVTIDELSNSDNTLSFILKKKREYPYLGNVRVYLETIKPQDKVSDFPIAYFDGWNEFDGLYTNKTWLDNQTLHYFAPPLSEKQSKLSVVNKTSNTIEVYCVKINNNLYIGFDLLPQEVKDLGFEFIASSAWVQGHFLHQQQEISFGKSIKSQKKYTLIFSEVSAEIKGVN